MIPRALRTAFAGSQLAEGRKKEGLTLASGTTPQTHDGRAESRTVTCRPVSQLARAHSRTTATGCSRSRDAAKLMVRHAEAMQREVSEASDRFRDVFGYDIPALRLYQNLLKSVYKYEIDATSAYYKTEYDFEDGKWWIEYAEKNRKEALEATRLLAAYLGLKVA
jgi:hypothetical protein